MAAHTNRLAGESSPYLLQHARNPVAWYPWGPEALDLARREDRPILLSIGYAACHWCHVMERESFEDEAIARRMNELFVNIKVDREERPDLDHIYQLVVQLMGRSGGWPLTVFLTPDQRPFFAGTYFPPKDRFGMPGFPKVLDAVADAYRDRRDEVEQQAQEITRAIERTQRAPGRAAGSASTAGPASAAELASSDLLRRASRALLARFDDRHGGIGTRPKFPNTMSLDVLLRQAALEGDRVAAESVELALDRMRDGGIWDHLRGGFHRYSTDERWLVPHFEKMLYDNALLLRLYVDGFRAFKKPIYAETAREIVGYLFAEMRDPEGGFYASQDADSEGVEGKFFVWTLDDLRAAVGEDRLAYDMARLVFGITEEGNFEHTGATVLSQHRTTEQAAALLDKGEASSAHLERCREALARARARMLAARDARPRPARDDKVLASWNGLLVGALADAGRALDEPAWIDAAARAFAALERKLVRGGRVGRYLKDGAPGGARAERGGAEAAGDVRPGFLDDQAYLGNAALDLYEATAEPRYVGVARAIADAMIAHHWDDAASGFFFTPDDGDALIARTQDIYDQAAPSAVSMAAQLCLRLAEIADDRYLAPAERQLDALAPTALENPFGLGQTVCALDRLARGSVTVVVVGEAGSAAAGALAREAFKAYLPNRAVVVVDPARAETAEAVKVVAAGKPARPGAAVAYVCRGRTCSAPVAAPAELRALLG
ncbi:thioredoxin domain-containing protein [Sorangium sp. So ce854]|uniref:thioredoxin domain-containing protein n=1 Tax=Sorangium sp. So ce854 TaxID=3133322 RepID=UPI003F6376E8